MSMRGIKPANPSAFPQWHHSCSMYLQKDAWNLQPKIYNPQGLSTSKVAAWDSMMRVVCAMPGFVWARCSFDPYWTSPRIVLLLVLGIL
jgi:hypothetical protein